jgi:hypothetical protein
MRKLTVLMAATMSLVSFAQTQRSPVKQPTKEIIFGDGDVIEGDLSTPDVEYFTPGSHALHPSLIKVRETFKDKVMNSVGEL